MTTLHPRCQSKRVFASAAGYRGARKKTKEAVRAVHDSYRQVHPLVTLRVTKS